MRSEEGGADKLDACAAFVSEGGSRASLFVGLCSMRWERLAAVTLHKRI